MGSDGKGVLTTLQTEVMLVCESMGEVEAEGFLEPRRSKDSLGNRPKPRFKREKKK